MVSEVAKAQEEKPSDFEQIVKNKVNRIENLLISFALKWEKSRRYKRDIQRTAVIRASELAFELSWFSRLRTGTTFDSALASVWRECEEKKPTLLTAFALIWMEVEGCESLYPELYNEVHGFKRGKQAGTCFLNTVYLIPETPVLLPLGDRNDFSSETARAVLFAAFSNGNFASNSLLDNSSRWKRSIAFASLVSSLVLCNYVLGRYFHLFSRDDFSKSDIDILKQVQLEGSAQNPAKGSKQQEGEPTSEDPPHSGTAEPESSVGPPEPLGSSKENTSCSKCSSQQFHKETKLQIEKMVAFLGMLRAGTKWVGRPSRCSESSDFFPFTICGTKTLWGDLEGNAFIPALVEYLTLPEVHSLIRRFRHFEYPYADPPSMWRIRLKSFFLQKDFEWNRK